MNWSLIKQTKKITDKLYNRYGDFSLTKKLPFTAVVQILIPILLLSTMIFSVVKLIIVKDAESHNSDVVKFVNICLSAFGDNLESISQNIMYEEELYSILNNDSQEALSYYDNMNRTCYLLQKFAVSNSEIQYIGLVNNQGHFYYTSGNTRSNSLDLLPYDVMLNQARKAEGRPYWLTVNDGVNTSSVYMVRTVYDTKTFEEIGLLFIAVKTDSIREIISNGLNIKDGGVIAVIDNNGEIISISDSSYIADIQSVDLKQQIKPYYDEDMLIVGASVSNIPWKTVACIPKKIINKNVNLLGLWIIIFSLLSLCLVLAMSVISVNDILIPVKKLIGVINDNKKGVTTTVSLNRKDEFGVLGQHFNEMIVEINKLTDAAYRENIARKEMQIKALQAQINPHFLFNTFDTVNWLALANGVPEISKIIVSLANIMNASMGKVSKLVTLQEEISYVDSYMYIQKERFNDSLVYECHCNEEILNAKIPPLLIQPVIENAIVHGNENKCGVCEVVLSIELVEDDIVITVTDNGVGISPDKLELIRKNIDDMNLDTTTSSSKPSIGLNNVNKRIKLNYGDEYGLSITSEEGKYTKVILVIPNISE